ncbi:CsbD-like protein [Palleronia aestuarii]|uniref:CsbD-like protein n=1 Tax=Palleronia aestuarii TaxID=568105 RepID=A0A2W7NH20_9RHOB|nr:CsbD family protein [Palleronia aestuarii]PZX19705.1 CsbD-like protein [Palleronia aestuarii]
MNKDKAEGAAKEVGGKVKEAAGKATNNERLKHEGQGDQVEGKAQKGVGKAKDAIKH